MDGTALSHTDAGIATPVLKSTAPYHESLLRHDQIHQTRSWHKEDGSVNLLNFRPPSRIISHLFDQRRGLDPEAVSLNKLHNAGEDPSTVNKPENDLFISQMRFVIHSGGNYTMGGTVKT